MKSIIKHIFLLIGYGLLFTLIGGLSAFIYLNTRFTAEPWHTADLMEEFRESRLKDIPDFRAYMQMEDRLFLELRKKVYKPVSPSESSFNRYITGSRSDPFTFPRNWNRSFEMKASSPRGGILMMHGLTDSPYSMRALAESMNKKGYWVVGLRLPGHGTSPASLTGIKWQDWAAASRLAARYLKEQIGTGRPMYIIGHSTGAALAVEYSIGVLSGEKLPEPAGLVLLSPCIGITPLAALTEVQLKLSALPGLEKIIWESVSLEYDPYKYNSFPVNAAKQIYLLTINNQEKLDALTRKGKLDGFPRVLAFQSVADSTIIPEAITEKLLNRFPSKGNSLVLYDTNQGIFAQGLINDTGREWTSKLLARQNMPYDLTILTNVNDRTTAVHAVNKKSMQMPTDSTPLSLEWPAGIFSLSHVALPFPMGDPVYGEFSQKGSRHIRLGKLELRGEKGVFIIPEKDLMRLRFNPFFPYQEKRIFSFLSGTE